MTTDAQTTDSQATDPQATEPQTPESQWCMAWLADNGAESGASKAALLKASLWPTGSVIKVAFLDGDPTVQNRVKAVAREWTHECGGPANVTFSFINDFNAADIRISFKFSGSWSVLGTTCRQVKPKNRATMNYGWLTPKTTDAELRRVVLHEFGHALGMVHEHLSPNVAIKWDKPKVYKDLSGPPNNWDKPTIDTNMFDAFAAKEMNASAFDKDSIMLYSFPSSWTTDGFSASLNSKLSTMDVAFIKKNYP